MADLPELRSKEQIQGDLIDGFLSRVSYVNDLNVGSVISQFFEAVAQENFKAAAAIIAMIDALSVDRAVGDALRRIANDKLVPIYPATAATGNVNITDLSFEKKQTTVYAGQPAPVAGSLEIFVGNTEGWSPTGSVYIGRGTQNSEGPLFYTAITSQGGGTYFKLTLSGTSPTTKFHNVGETVILAQGGNRTIPAGKIVQTPQGANVSAVQFVTTSQATILDGEVTVTDIPVICQRTGNAGNVPKDAIQEVLNLGFEASANNPKAFFSGRAADTEDDIRQRIKDYEQAKAKGTEVAIRTSSIDVVAPDELKKVQSANVIRYADKSSALVFDDSTGYEALFNGQGYELIVDSALGGEKELQLRRRSIAQSRIKSVFTAPFNVADLSYLTVEVQGVQSSHQFKAADFRVLGAATAFEVAASINGDPNINFLASTADGGKSVVIYPKDRLINDIKVIVPTSGENANDVLGLSEAIEYSMRLYKNDQPLNQDGIAAKVATRIISSWSASIATGDTLSYVVDDTPEITITVLNSDFQKYDAGAVVSSSTDIALWIKVLNAKMAGVDVVLNGEVLDFYSNRGASDESYIEITGGTLKDKIFQAGAAIKKRGQGSDYTLNKQTGQIGLNVALSPGDKVSAGSEFTRANILTTGLPSGPANAGRFWTIVDGAVTPVSNSLQSNTKIKFEKSGTKLSIVGESQLAAPEGFDDVKVGDWVLVWANSGDAAPMVSNQGFWRVESVSTGLIIVDDGTTSRSNLSTFTVPPTNRIVIARSSAPIQLVSYPASSLASFAAFIQSSVEGVNVEIVGSSVRISTQTFGDDGELYFMAVDSGAEALSLIIDTPITNVPSHFGFKSTLDSEAGIPDFRHSTLGTFVSDSVFDVPAYQDLGGKEDEFLQMLDQYDTTLISTVSDSNAGRRSLVRRFDPAITDLSVLRPAYMSAASSPMQAGDRYFLRSSYKFDSEDFVNFVLNRDPVTQAFKAPAARRLIVSSHSSPTQQDFSADDGESNLDLSNQSSFYDFDFANFKAYRQASTVLTDGTYSLKIRAADFGPNGDKISVGIDYPANAGDTAMSHAFEQEDMLKVRIKLPAGTARTASWDQTTAFSVSKTTTGGKDLVTYQWRVGLEPDFSTLVSNVTPGDIAIISGNSDLLSGNDGISARVTAVSPTAFTIERPTGPASNDDLVASTITNQSGTTTVVTTTNHNLSSGQRVGLWSTASADGITYPFESTYTVTVISPTSFSFATPVAVPGGTIASGSHVSGTITITTSAAHGLLAGNIVLISGIGGAYDGTYAVNAVIGPNQFQYVKNGSSAPVASSGRFDFQSYLPATVENIATISKTGTLVTVNITGHGFTAGDLVKIQSVTIDAWSNLTAYVTGDIVRFAGINYEAIASTTGDQPNISPAQWQVTTRDLGGTFVVNSTAVNSFDYYYDQSGATSGTVGTATHMVQSGHVARALGGSTAANLQFVEVSSTAQEVFDYVSANLADKLECTLVSSGTAAVALSTADTDAATNYLSGNVTNLKTFVASREIELIVSAAIPAGSSITVAGLTGGLVPYNGTYNVHKYTLSAGIHRVRLQSTVFAGATGTNAVSGTYVGAKQTQKLEDGENSVLSSDLQSIISMPQFTLKNPWVNAPALGEEIRLVAISNEQLSRFWNKLVVTGLSNIANISLSKFGSELQVSTKTFGSKGSVEVSGGYANDYTAALVGSAASYNSKSGKFDIPYSLRKGLIARQYVQLQNRIRQNKIPGFNTASTLQVFNDGVQIISGGGTFQTQRSTTHTDSTQIRIERQGDFVAFISVSGTNFGLTAAGVAEGDWVRIKNVDASLWSNVTSYSVGNRVKYGTRNYTSLVNSNLGNQPDTSPASWRLEEFSQSNQGVYQIVRVFGDNTFYVQSDSIVPEQVVIGDSDNMKFYSYDSVMPGDTLVISTNVLSPQNVGRYTVVDESYGVGYAFPTATRIYTTPVPTAQGATALGAENNLVNIEELAPLTVLKKIMSVGPGADELATVLVDSPNLMDRISSSAGAYMTGYGKLNLGSSISFGVDSYRYYQGLIQELNKVIYGDPADPARYPGVRAAGTDIDIKPAIIKRLTIGLGARLRTGVPFTEVRERIKAAVAGYINRLGVGEQVSISSVVSAAQSIPGVLAISVISPAYDSSNDLIAVGADEKAFIADPTTDVTVTVVAT